MREVRYIRGQSFCEKGHVPSKRLFMVSVMEDPHSHMMRQQPPHTGMLVLIVYDPQSRERTLMNFGVDELRDAIGESNPKLTSLEKGFLDFIVHRNNLKDKISNFINMTYYS